MTSTTHRRDLRGRGTSTSPTTRQGQQRAEAERAQTPNTNNLPMEGKSWFLLLILLYSSSVTGPNTNDLPIVGWMQWFLLISLAGLLSAYFISGIRCHRGPPAQPVEMRSSWSCLLILGLGLVALPLQALTLDECGEELHNMYPGCMKVKATLPPSDTSVDAIQHLM